MTALLPGHGPDMATICHLRLGTPATPEALGQLLSVLGRTSPAVQALPPGAALADVAGVLRLHQAHPAELAQRLRVQALALYGLPVSVGIATSWTVAAMASARAGTSGVRYIPPSQTAHFLDPLPVGALYGIRRTQAQALSAYGLTTLGRLAAAPESTVMRILGGRAGRLVHERARGIDRRVITPGRMPESTSARFDFDRDMLDGPAVRAVLSRLTATLGTRLRERGQAARGITLALRMADRADLARTQRLTAPTGHTEDLRATTYKIMDSYALQRARIRRITLTAEDLVAAEHAPTQLSIDPLREVQLRAEPVLDRLTARYGPGTIGPASAFLRVS
ncbi:hypothetical protein AB0G73_23930 [Streptomyces sp. NPDC020719]|uniref:DNA polymerase Y family protein n=1 Tax=Streptomyces sp. NPDC020719 TaxID=3154896 RepID=UPI0033E6D285